MESKENGYSIEDKIPFLKQLPIYSRLNWALNRQVWFCERRSRVGQLPYCPSWPHPRDRFCVTERLGGNCRYSDIRHINLEKKAKRIWHKQANSMMQNQTINQPIDAMNVQLKVRSPRGLWHVSNTFNCCGFCVNVYTRTASSRMTTILQRNTKRKHWKLSVKNGINQSTEDSTAWSYRRLILDWLSSVY